jgi:hypothetical protein
MKRGEKRKGRYFTSFRAFFHEVEEEVEKRNIDKNRLQTCVIGDINRKLTSPNRKNKPKSCQVIGHIL